MKIKLLKPHEHAGRTYPAGSELDLPTADAQWLIALTRAEAVADAKPTKAKE